MTPGINIAVKAKVPHKIHAYTHNPGNQAYGLEAAEKLRIPAARVFKTLVVHLDNNTLAVAVIPVSSQLSMKRMACGVGAKKVQMAAKSDVERSTSYILGGVSPLGQKKRLKTIIDASAANYPTIYVSAGRRGVEIELAPQDLKNLTNGIIWEISQNNPA